MFWNHECSNIRSIGKITYRQKQRPISPSKRIVTAFNRNLCLYSTIRTKWYCTADLQTYTTWWHLPVCLCIPLAQPDELFIINLRKDSMKIFNWFVTLVFEQNLRLLLTFKTRKLLSMIAIILIYGVINKFYHLRNSWIWDGDIRDTRMGDECVFSKKNVNYPLSTANSQ